MSLLFLERSCKTLEEYKSNSHRSKEEKQQLPDRKKVQQVTKAKVKKKGAVRKFADTFISEDVSSVKDYIINDFIIPLIQKTICDVFEEIPKTIFYGKSSKGRRSYSDRVSYRSYSDRDRRYRDREEPRNRSRFDSDDIVFDSRGEAEKVLSVMDEIMDEYDLVRVSDLYDLAGLSCPYVWNDYGWTNIRNAEVVRVRDGYVIKMPRATNIR